MIPASLKNSHYTPLIPELLRDPLCASIIQDKSGPFFEALARIEPKPQPTIPAHCCYHLKQRGFLILKGYLGYPRDVAPLTEFRLSPLHVAVIVGNAIVIKALLNAGFDPEPQDVRGWTPRHHAAVLGRKKVFDLLKERAVFDSVNNHMGTAADLLKLVRLPLTDEVRVWNRVRNALDFKPVSAVFREPEVLAFSDDVHVAAATLLNNWVTPPKFYDELRKEENQRLALLSFDSMKMQTKVAIDEAPVDDNGKDLPSFVGKGLVAAEAFEPHELVCEYGGQYVDISNSDHCMRHLDAARVRSYGSLALDSHPNARAVPVIIRGICRFVLIAVEPIKAGDAITYNYAEHRVKEFDAIQLEARPKAFTAFWTSPVVQGYLTEGFPDQMQLSGDLEAESMRYRLTYPFYTLRAYYELVLKGIAHHQDLFRFQTKPALSYRHPLLPAAAIVLQEAFSKLNPADKAQIASSIATKPFQVTFNQLFALSNAREKLTKLHTVEDVRDLFNIMFAK